MKNEKLNKKMAKVFLSIGEKVYAANANRVKWDDRGFGPWYVPDTCTLGKKKRFYFNFDVRDKERVGVDYFRFSGNFKVFYLNIGAAGYFTRDYETKIWFLIPKSFWFDFRFKPYSRLIRYIKDHTRFGRRFSHFVDLYHSTGSISSAYTQFTCTHDLQSESHITGDSGSETFHCSKCGFHSHVTYY